MAKLIDALRLTKSTHSREGALDKRTFILHSTTKHLKNPVIALLRRHFFNVLKLAGDKLAFLSPAIFIIEGRKSIRLEQAEFPARDRRVA